MSFKLMLLVTLALAAGTEAAEQRMNPIRKVMQRRVLALSVPVSSVPVFYQWAWGRPNLIHVQHMSNSSPTHILDTVLIVWRITTIVLYYYRFIITTHIYPFLSYSECPKSFYNVLCIFNIHKWISQGTILTQGVNPTQGKILKSWQVTWNIVSIDQNLRP